MRTAIIYSPFNLDSCLAAALFANKHKEKFEFISYSRGMNLKIYYSYEKIISLGADLSGEDIAMLCNVDSLPIIQIYTYPNSSINNNKSQRTRVLQKQNQVELIEFDEELRNKNNNESTSVPGEILSITLKIINSELFNWDNNSELETVKHLAEIVNKYCSFKPLTKEETKYLFCNIKMIQKAATGKHDFNINAGQLHDSINYGDYVSNIRDLINRNISMTFYSNNNNNGFITPTICVGEHDAIWTMRFISYSHDDVISFEDMRDYRIYRIHTTKNIEWYVKCFEPIDIWSEGNLFFLKTDLPRHNRTNN